MPRDGLLVVLISSVFSSAAGLAGSSSATSSSAFLIDGCSSPSSVALFTTSNTASAPARGSTAPATVALTDECSAATIGTPGVPWGEQEKAAWRDSCAVQRSYKDEVLSLLDDLASSHDVMQYGALSVDAKRYPLRAVKVRGWAAGKPAVLVTGGVHGCETSGVQGALLFCEIFRYGRA